MRRGKASQRSRLIFILMAAGAVGYVAGNWHALAFRNAAFSTGLSPSQNVALRFPEAPADGAAADIPAATSVISKTSPASPSGPATAAMMQGGSEFALLSPEPMAGPAAARPALQVALAPAPLPTVPQPRAETEIKPPPIRRGELKAPAQSAVRHANRPGFVFNDAQIASIKGRLHLTPDQERMWPSVEAALRSIAYAKARDANRRDASAATEFASLDPDSAEVQDLKSAAIPLIMSFNDDQKNEVRNLAHVMGLDRLASQF